MKLAELTWAEVDQLDRKTVVIAQFGAMEQHGLHMPMNTDALIGQSIAERLDQSLDGRLLLLPTQWLGLSTHHMKFPGTLTVSPETFIAMAFEIVSSIASAGFTNILILNSHGGNAAALDVTVTKCKMKFPKHRLVNVTYWNAAAAELASLRSSKLGGMGHACELETSLVLAQDERLVKKDWIAADGKWPSSSFFAKDMLKGGAASFALTFDEMSTSGTVGDPRTASAEKGLQFFSVIVDKLNGIIRLMESDEIDQFLPVSG